jgi:hypothetical protein
MILDNFCNSCPESLKRVGEITGIKIEKMSAPAVTHVRVATPAGPLPSCMRGGTLLHAAPSCALVEMLPQVSHDARDRGAPELVRCSQLRHGHSRLRGAHQGL